MATWVVSKVDDLIDLKQWARHSLGLGDKAEDYVLLAVDAELHERYRDSDSDPSRTPSNLLAHILALLEKDGARAVLVDITPPVGPLEEHAALADVLQRIEIPVIFPVEEARRGNHSGTDDHVVGKRATTLLDEIDNRFVFSSTPAVYGVDKRIRKVRRMQNWADVCIGWRQILAPGPHTVLALLLRGDGQPSVDATKRTIDRVAEWSSVPCGMGPYAAGEEAQSKGVAPLYFFKDNRGMFIEYILGGENTLARRANSLIDRKCDETGCLPNFRGDVVVVANKIHGKSGFYDFVETPVGTLLGAEVVMNAANTLAAYPRNIAFPEGLRPVIAAGLGVLGGALSTVKLGWLGLFAIGVVWAGLAGFWGGVLELEFVSGFIAHATLVTASDARQRLSAGVRKVKAWLDRWRTR